MLPTESLKKLTSAKSQVIGNACRPNVTLTVATRAERPELVLLVDGPESQVHMVEPLSANLLIRKARYVAIASAYASAPVPPLLIWRPSFVRPRRLASCLARSR